MSGIAGQGLLFLYCFLTVMPVSVDTEFVVAFLATVICVSAVRIKGESGAAVLFMVLFLSAACFFPKFLFFSPVMLYSILQCGKYILGILSGVLCIFFYAKGEPKAFILLVFGCMFACFLTYQNRKYDELDKMFRKTRDDGRELNLLLEERNQSLLKRQDNEIYMAKLKERNRIAREIHDHVGHMLSRAILMTGAMKAVNVDERMKGALDQLEDTLNTAMTNVRESVHDIHDDSVNLKEALTELAKEYTFCQARLIYDMGYVLPGELKYSFIAIVKEALNNVSRHSDASEVVITAREHPGMYQLIIQDNGNVDSGNENGLSGIGIRNMKDRICALGGNIQIRKKKGFRIYITVPKKERMS